MVNTISRLGEHDIQVLWQTGELQSNSVWAAVKERKPAHCCILPFIEHMEEAYAIADLVVSAGGAVTLAELAVLGKPAIIVPLSAVTESHQSFNARALSEKGACIIIEEHELVERLPGAIIDTISNGEKLHQMGERIRQFAQPQAAKLIFDEIVQSVSG
jgi:UDP-N-acetylglucosamine--N-acetylmuramyl-(pentapeptide) pyrophosphoryl-undecaprenol N-acetylglucosamine transferase